jgi:enoyl-CoA hydratase
MEASAQPRLSGWGKAAELVLTGAHIDAAAAYRIGLRQRLVPYVQLDEAVESWIALLLACGPRAVRLQKRLLVDWDRMSVTDAARADMQAYTDAYHSDEPRRMMLAFGQRQRP